MKTYIKIKLIIILFFSTLTTNAQFIHLKPNSESEDFVSIIFEDGSIKNGFVKNNRVKNKALRALSLGTNASAFSNPEMVVNHIMFKSDEEGSDFQEIETTNISQVVFKNAENGFLVYDLTTMYDINAKTLKVDYSNPKKMFFQANNLPGFKRYRIFLQTIERGRTVMYTPYYFIKHPQKNEVVSVNPWSMIIHDRVVNYFKFVGSDCDKFLSYLDKIADKKSEEYKEFKQAKKDLKEESKSKKKSKKNDTTSKKYTNDEMEILRQNGSAKPYEFLFEYFYQKYIEMGCVN